MKLLHFATEHSSVVAIAGDPGRIYTPLVWIDGPMRLAKIPNGDVTRYGREFSAAKPTLKQAAKRMLRAGKKLGISKAAKKHLRSAL